MTTHIDIFSKLPDFKDIGFKPSEIPPLPDPLKHADLSISQIKEMSDDRLLALLNGESEIDGFLSLSTQNAITSELSARAIHKAARPHWSVIPLFVVSVVAMAASCIAAYPVLFPPAQSPAAVVAPPTQPVPLAKSTSANSLQPLPSSLPVQPRKP